VKIIVTGSSGLIGTALVGALRGDGHEVRRLVRRPPQQADEARWDPANGTVDDAAMADAEAVVNLGGVGIGDRRWSDAHKKAVLQSRIDATTTIAKAVAAHAATVRVLVSASAVGWYGDRGEDVLDETAPNGAGYLADVVWQWEAATSAASATGVRVVHIRSGIVLSPEGGALGQMLPIFRLGLGGRLGSGRQWMPWIAMADEIAAIRFAMDDERLTGPVNLTSPEPVRNRELTASLGRVVHRPAVAFVPGFALRLALGGFADEGLLVSQRVVPQVLLDAGFTFAHPALDEALDSML
jgi:uncharacterized protein (TIGR01777 family)